MKSAFLIFFLFCSFVSNAQQQFSFVFLNKNPEAPQLSKEEGAAIMKGHMANIEKMAKEGKLIAAGPFEGGGGIFIFRASTIEEINEWLSPDPGIQAKRWKVEMHGYTPRHNSVCSAQAPYEMVNYSFVRFDAIVSKETASTYPAIIRKHDDYLKEIVATGNVVTEGIFGDNAGGILVMKGEVNPALFESDPGVQEGLIQLTTRKLFIAKGSFCEK